MNVVENIIFGSSSLDLEIAEYLFGYQWIEIQGYRLIIRPETLATMGNYKIADKDIPIYPNPSSLEVPNFSKDTNLAAIALQKLSQKGWGVEIKVLQSGAWGIEIYNEKEESLIYSEDKALSRAIALGIVQCIGVTNSN